MGNKREFELAYKSVELIREIIQEVKFFGEDLLKDIRIDKSYKGVVIEDVSGSTLEYSLSEVSYILTDSISGLWKFGNSFEESIKSIENRKKVSFQKLDRNQFIEYAGKIDYIKFRFNKILEELRKIEREL
ncbi:MAG: hypothetical protein E7207_05100 [Clostridium butyricum]|nr:hypothetical protein [Clostridium butyricum]